MSSLFQAGLEGIDLAENPLSNINIFIIYILIENIVF